MDTAVIETEAPPARARLTLARAVDQWAECQLAIEGLRILQKEAAEVLLANAIKTNKRTFKDRIAVVQTGGSLVLDTDAVKAHLGRRLPDFMKHTKLGWTLRLLK